MKYFGLLLLLGVSQMGDALPDYYMDDNCNQTIMLDHSISQINLHLTHKFIYNPNMRCALVINATIPTDKLMLYFNSMSIEDSTYCDRDWLELRDGGNSNAPYVSGTSGRMCGLSYENYVHTKIHTSGHSLFLYFRSDSRLQYKGFQMIITRYHTGSCYSDEYSCSNGRCVEDSLTCNGYNPCGDHSDCPFAAGAIAGIVVGGFFFLLFLVILTIVCRRRRLRRRGYISQTEVKTDTHETAGYNQPVPTQYPAAVPRLHTLQQPYPTTRQQDPSRW